LTNVENPNLIAAIYYSRKRFYALREFTLEGGQQELERQARERKEAADRAGRPNSIDSLRSPVIARSPNLSNVPEEHSAFAIGDDDESDTETSNLMNESASMDTPRPRTGESADELPVQLRGMSEKARGKMPVSQNSFSRTNSISSIQGFATGSAGGHFQPTPEWVSRSP
jgi:High-temperature-induced dauer-formation protein